MLPSSAAARRARCAAFCAAWIAHAAIEREKFPREKVCGDCINPSCWPVLRPARRRRSSSEAAAWQARLRRVHFNQRPKAAHRPSARRRRRDRGQAQPIRQSPAVGRATLGAEVRDGATLIKLDPNGNSKLEITAEPTTSPARVSGRQLTDVIRPSRGCWDLLPRN